MWSMCSLHLLDQVTSYDLFDRVKSSASDLQNIRFSDKIFRILLHVEVLGVSVSREERATEIRPLSKLEILSIK